MIWLRKRPPNNNDKRIVNKFLWFPKCIGQKCKWLTNAAWWENFECDYVNFEDYPHCWQAKEWIESDPKSNKGK
jgi:hypothetical protein